VGKRLLGSIERKRDRQSLEGVYQNPETSRAIRFKVGINESKTIIFTVIYI
jgi:hypothetical protein